MQILAASVNDYEDVATATGEIVTVYIVNVHLHPKNTPFPPQIDASNYCITKRYSEFRELYDNLRQLIPSDNDYRFPKKSMFNNNAQFTKERRVRGFDELLKLLVKHTCGNQRPPPPYLENFLEINKRITDSSRVNIAGEIRKEKQHDISSSYHLKQRQESGSFDLSVDIQSPKVVGMIEKRGDDSSLEKTVRVNPIDAGNFETSDIDAVLKGNQHQGNAEETPTNHFSVEIEKELNRTVRKHFLTIFSSSMKVCGSVYLLLVFINFIDVSKTRFSKILTTIGALGMLVTFLRIVFLKIETRRSCVCNDSH